MKNLPSQVQQKAVELFQNAYDIPIECPEPDWGFWGNLINIWIAKWGGGSLVLGAALGWIVLWTTFFGKPINKLMSNIFGFNLDDLRDLAKKNKKKKNREKK